jgi:hypothetical protein
MDINGEETNSNIEKSMEIISFMMHEILPSSIGHFLLLSSLHAIECHKRLNTLLRNPILLLGMKTRIESGGLSSITITGGNETAPEAWVSGAS